MGIPVRERKNEKNVKEKKRKEKNVNFDTMIFVGA